MAKQAAIKGGSERAFSTSLIRESIDTRFVDAGFSVMSAAGSVLWTASRPTTGQQLGWALAGTLIGAFAAVEGRAELKHVGFGLLGANAAYLALRLSRSDLRPPGEQGK